jgi:hypothetical protein
MPVFHKLLATDGLFPNMFSHYACSVLGVFDIELSIPKSNLGYSDLEYKITIVIKHKDKRWEYSTFVSYFTLKGYEVITATFNKISNRINDLRVKFTSKKALSETPSVKANIINR